MVHDPYVWAPSAGMRFRVWLSMEQCQQQPLQEQKSYRWSCIALKAAVLVAVVDGHAHQRRRLAYELANLRKE